MKKENILKIFFILAVCLAGCREKKTEAPVVPASALEQAESLSAQSRSLSDRALQTYQEALKDPASDKDTIYYKLGELYAALGELNKAIEALVQSDLVEAKKLLAVSYYRAGDYTEALGVFEKLGELEDDTYLYDYATTCEKHNLFPKAMELYAKIEDPALRAKAQKNMETINALMGQSDLSRLDPEVREAILRAPTQEQYPEAGAVYLFTKEAMEVKEDRTVEYVQHCLVKIMNERGKDLGEVQVDYDSTYEKVDIDLARTIKTTGEVVSVGSKHIRDVSKYLNFPLYSNARVKIISMPEVSEGVFLEYKVRTQSRKMVDEDKFLSSFVLQSEEPFLSAEFHLTLPQGQTFHQKNLNESYNFANASLSPVVTEREDGRTTYTWTFRDIAQIIPEPQMPPLAEITPVMLMTNFSDWQEIHGWWWPLAKDKIVVNDDIRAKIKELVPSGEMSPREKAKAIYSFCAKDIRYVAVEYGQAGFEPHPAPEIFANKYGDCKDQAILLIAMLREVGIEAYPVLIGTAGVPVLDEGFPCLLFNHCIAVAKIDGEYIFMDPTAETVLFGDLPAGDQGRKVLVCFEDKAEVMTIPRLDASRNVARQRTVMTFDESEKVLASRRVETVGVFDQVQRGWLRYTMPVLVREELQQRIQEIIPGSKLIDYEIQNLKDMNAPIILSYNFEGADFLIKAGMLRVVPQIPQVGLSLVSKAARTYPIDFRIPVAKDSAYEIILPSIYRIKSLPQSVVVSDNPWFSYENTYEAKGNTIIIREKNESKADRVPATDYAQYKRLLEQLSKDIRQSIILEKIKK